VTETEYHRKGKRLKTINVPWYTKPEIIIKKLVTSKKEISCQLIQLHELVA